jgi:hypothetical protein
VAEATLYFGLVRGLRFKEEGGGFGFRWDEVRFVDVFVEYLCKGRRRRSNQPYLSTYLTVRSLRTADELLIAMRFLKWFLRLLVMDLPF